MCSARGFRLLAPVLIALLPFAASCDARERSGGVPSGEWGGEHIRLAVTATGATIEYDCARGTIDEPLRPDEEGNFEARGIHRPEAGGPTPAGSTPPALAARYRGWTDGSEMRLTVTLADTGASVGTFSLVHGRKGHLERCY